MPVTVRNKFSQITANSQACLFCEFRIKVPALFLYFIGLLVRSYRWSVLLRPVEHVSSRQLVSINVVGLMANNVLPLRTGEFVRAYALSQKTNISKSTGLATIAVERIFDGVVMLGFIFLNLPLITHQIADVNTIGWIQSLALWGGIAFAIALVIFAVWSPPRALVGALLFGGINAIQFRLQAAGTTIPSAFLAMLPYIFTIVVLVIITWYEGLRNRAGGPAALGSPYVREEKK